MKDDNLTKKQFGNLKIALVHDFLVQYGGAERVLEVLSRMFPEAPIYTLLYEKERLGDKFSSKDIRPSFLQKFPRFLKKRYKWLLPLMPVAPETFDLREFDLVITSSGAWSKGIVTRLNTINVSYTHSPMRFAWDWKDSYISEQQKGKVLGFFARIILNYLRIWDFQAADRVDFFIANSKYTQARIKKYYRKNSEVIYPSISDKFLKAGESANEDERRYFLAVSRFSPYKNIEAIVDVFEKLDLPLVIVGKGNKKYENHLKRIAAKNVKFVGFVSDEKLIEYYKNARALVCASVEDFGLTAVEAMSQGTPVVALKEGGYRELVDEGAEGELFESTNLGIMADAIRRFMENEKKYDRVAIKERARKFSEGNFQREIQGFLEKIM